VSGAADLLIDRRRLKRRLIVWRVIAVLAVVGAVLVAADRRTGGFVAARHIARVEVRGIIGDGRSLLSTIEDVGKDRDAAAMIVAIDSPGGSFSGGEALTNAIAKVATQKPVVAVMGGTAASAGYMVAMPAARVIARAGTITGSIGVLLQTAEFSTLLDHLGVAADTIVSGPLKDQPNPVHKLSPEGRVVLQGLVTDLYEQFVAIVASGRHMDADAVRKLADGRAYTGRQALALGLVDAIGGEADARAWLAETKGIGREIPVRDAASRGLVEQIFGADPEEIWKSVLSQGLKIDGAWAIWQPSES
jgi:protease-4